MADPSSVTVPALPAAAALTNAESVPFHQDGRLVRATPAELVEGGLPYATLEVGGRTATVSEHLEGAVTQGVTTKGAAFTAITALRVLRRTSAGLAHASATVRDHATAVVGVALATAAASAQASYRSSGLMQDAAFNFAPGPVFLGADGLLTQVYPAKPSALFILQVGLALSKTELLVGIDRPIFLAA